MASALAAAELPLTISESNELTPAWMNRLAMAKMAFCKPAGTPSSKMRLVMPRSSWMACRSSA